MRRCVVAAITSLCLVAAGARASPAASPAVAWLVVEANEGGSSGGHAALRIDGEVFHFQHQGNGWLRLRRDDLGAFHHAYVLLGNRSVEELRLAVSGETRDLLRDGFVRRLLAQDAWFEARDARERNAAWLASLAAAPGAAVRALPALGFFLPDGDGPAAAPGASAALASLRDRIAHEHGAHFLAARRERLASAIRALPLSAEPQAPPPPEPDRLVAFPAVAADRDLALETARLALAVLEAAPGLRPDAAPLTLDPALALRDGEADALRAAAAAIEADLASLVASSGDDFGPALALGLARLAAIEASLTAGRLVLLDAFPDDAPTRRLEGAAGARHLAWLEATTRTAFEQARARALGRKGFLEVDWTRLESDASRWRDARRAQESGAPLRLAHGLLVPSRAARRSDLVAPAAAARERALAAAAARAALAAHEAALDALYPYRLLSRNCVTELFATIDAALAQAPEVRGRSADVAQAAAVAAASRARLGGVVDGSRGLAFIPAASAGAVAASYHVAARFIWPSFRERRLAELARSEPALVVALRESNVLTSTLYERDPADSRFLFFDEDAVLVRPLTGALNVVYGLGQAAVGLLTLPVDGADRLGGGLRGVLFSLPELAFWSLRKGALAYADDAAWPEAPAVVEGARRSARAATPRRGARRGVPHSCRRATIGSMPAARRAGTKPKPMPTAAANATAPGTAAAGMTMGQPATAETTPAVARPRSAPTTPPAAPSTVASTRNWSRT